MTMQAKEIAALVQVLRQLPDPRQRRGVRHHKLSFLTPCVVAASAGARSFAAETLRRWWAKVGSPTYPQAHLLLVCPDAGVSNGYRVRLWSFEPARLATEIGLPNTVWHFPPGTSKVCASTQPGWLVANSGKSSCEK